MTPAHYLAELERETHPTLVAKLFHDLQEDLTPLEIDALRPVFARLGDKLGKAPKRSGILRMLRREYPRAYRRSDPLPGVTFYSGRQGRRADKTLLINLTGARGYAMLPMAELLQYWPDEQFDIVRLRDVERDFYRAGFDGLRMALPLGLKALGEIVHSDAYRRVIVLGFSMGAFPALIGGRAIGAERAIALGGLAPWDIHHLLSGDRAVAYDGLCACDAVGATALTAVYCDGHLRDRHEAQRAQRAVGARLRPISGSDSHNPIDVLRKRKELRGFFRQMLDYERDGVSRRLPKGAGRLRRWRHGARRLVAALKQRLRPAESADYKLP